LAYIATGERDGSDEQLNRGYRLLAPLFPQYPKDPEVLSALGMVLFLKDQFGDAAKLLEEAARVRPNYAPGYERLGVVWRAAGDKGKARAALERAIELDEAREAPYHLLADLSDSPDERRRILERYLRIMPGSIIAREALKGLLGRDLGQ
jgi:tetratricopeptide (TPR) repeat protein